MTKEQYEKISAPYRKNEKSMKIIKRMDLLLTLIIYAVYPMVLFTLLYQKCWLDFTKCLVIPAISFVAVSVFRKIYSAPRPYEVLDILPLIKKDTKGKSFPSRHVFSVFIIGMTVFFVSKPWGIVVFVIGILMGYVRVAGGVHFPKDVFAGAIIGILCGLFYYVI